MTPTYIANAFDYITIEAIASSTPWIQVTDARLECFMSRNTATYTYGEGRGVRTYTPVPYSPIVDDVQFVLNRDLFGPRASDPLARCPGPDVYAYNVCFLNRYDNAQMQLGWHSDDSPGMNHDHPIAVVSFGQAREIWWREIGQTGVIPHDHRQLLEHGSVFIMPAGMQRTHQHRIPKGDRDMSMRVSLTFRNYTPPQGAV